MWGGDPDCEHQWGEAIHGKSASGGLGGSTLDGSKPGKERRPRWKSTFCACGAWKGSLGSEPTIHLYIEHMVDIFRELWRVLRDDGTLWLNMGDAYTSGNRDYRDPGQSHMNGGARVAGLLEKGTRAPTPDGLKPKDLIMMPARLALALQADGWWVRQDNVWEKLNPLPESVSDRTTSAHEYVFHLAKSGSPLFWTHRDGPGTRVAPEADYRYIDRATGEEHESEPEDWSDELIDCPTCGGTREVRVEVGQVSLFDGVPTLVKDCEACAPPPEIPGDPREHLPPGKVRRWRRKNLWKGHDYYYDATAIREPIASASIARLNQESFWNQHGGPKDLGTSGVNPNRSGRKTLENLAKNANWDKMTKAEQQAMGANKRDVWRVATQPMKDAHFATFPEGLVEIPLFAGSSEYGVCPICKAPWARVVDKGRTTMNIRVRDAKKGILGDKSGFGGKEKATHEEMAQYGYEDGATESAYPTGSTANRLALLRQAARKHGGEYIGTVTTRGWRPTCDCDAPSPTAPEPAVVLDPFAGSGTVGVVALKHGRSFVGIELSPKYAKMARNRIKRYDAKRLKEVQGDGTQDSDGGEPTVEAARGEGAQLADGPEIPVPQEAR